MKVKQTVFEHSVIFQQHLYPENSSLNVGFIFQLHFVPDQKQLKKAAGALHKQSSNLRAHFDVEKKYISNCLPPKIKIDAVPNISQEQVQAVFLELKQRPFDLSHPPLYRIKIIAAGNRRCYVMVVANHAIVDGYGIWLLLKRLLGFYQAPGKLLQNDAWLIQKFSERYPNVCDSVAGRPELFALLDSSLVAKGLPCYAANACNVTLSFSGYSKLLDKIKYAKESAAVQNALTLYLVQCAIAKCLPVKEFLIKHSTLNRNDRDSLTYLGFVADAAVQHVTVNALSEKNGIQENLNFLKKIPHGNTFFIQAKRFSDLPIEICYGNFSNMFSARRQFSDVVSMIPQPTGPHMWGDHTKLKINAHQEGLCSHLILMGLAHYIQPDWLTTLGEKIRASAEQLNEEL